MITLKRWLRRNPKPTTLPEPVVIPFLKFPCGECRQEIRLVTRLEAGQVATISCPGCEKRWAIYSPQLVITSVKDQPLAWEPEYGKTTTPA